MVSGFVISQSLASRTPASLGAMLLDFYRRRVLRLLPALLVMLMATFVLSALFIPARGATSSSTRPAGPRWSA